MPSPAVRPRPALLVMLALAALLGAGCSSTGGDDQSSGFRLGFLSGTQTATADVVFLRLHASSGSLIVLDIVGRSITPPLDGLNLAMSFDPAVLEAVSFSDDTFLGTCGRTRSDNTILLCADSVASGTANTTGTLIFSAVPIGASPTPFQVSGEVVLVSVTFRARATGISPVYFHDATNPAPGGSISEVSSAVDPSGAAAVVFEPGTTGPAEVEVSRS